MARGIRSKEAEQINDNGQAGNDGCLKIERLRALKIRVNGLI